MTIAGITREDVTRFTCGSCHVLAREINKLTGWPIHCFLDDYEGPDHHAFVIPRRNWRLNVEGFLSASEHDELWGSRAEEGHQEFSYEQISFWGMDTEDTTQRAQTIAPLLVALVPKSILAALSAAPAERIRLTREHPPPTRSTVMARDIRRSFAENKIHFCAPGEEPQNHQPGDFILVDSDKSVLSKLIRVGERHRYHGARAVFARFNHAALVINSEHVVEALTGGVQISPISKYAANEYVLVSADPIGVAPDSEAAEAMRANAVSFAEGCVGERYAFLTDACIAFGLLTGGGLTFGYDGQSICSGLVARSLERMGYDFGPRNPAEIMPADLAYCFDVGRETVIADSSRFRTPAGNGESERRGAKIAA